MTNFLIYFVLYYGLHILVKCSPLILFSNKKDIRIIDAESLQNEANIIVKGLNEAAAIDFHYSAKKICWSDIGAEVIKCTTYDPKSNKTGNKIELVRKGTFDGIACDWINNNLYWTDSEAHRIEVINLNSLYRKVLYWLEIFRPRSIVVVPSDGLLFWTDWGEIPKIERGGMDGDPESRRIIVKEDVRWPNGLTVDYDKKKLYWVDGLLHQLSSSNFDGQKRKVITTKLLPHPFYLTTYKNTIYWTDWNAKSIQMIDMDGTNKKLLLAEGISPMGIHIYNSHKQPISKSYCSFNNGGCSHLCLASPSSSHYSCTCKTGVSLLNSNICANGPQHLLLLAKRADIRLISLDTPDFTDIILPLQNIKHTIAVDFDPVDKKVYWTDNQIKSIQRSLLNGKEQADVVSTEIFYPDEIAVDWIARNLYWTDAETDRIEVIRLNGSFRKVIINEGLDEPRAIEVDPLSGLMFWSDWGQKARIERSNLDGTNRLILVNTSIMWPNGIALDSAYHAVYWCDAKMDKIEVIDMDGKNRKIIIGESLSHAYGLTLLGDYIYWTDWQHRSIERVKKYNGSGRSVIIDHLPDLMGLKAVNMSMNLGTNSCAKNNGGCNHLCLYRPQGHVCGCSSYPYVYELQQDGVSCIIPEAFLLLSRKGDIRRLSLQKSHQSSIISLSLIKEASSIDYDFQDNRMYWSDTNLKTINRAHINGSNQETVIEFNLEFPESIAVDWISHNLYWADTGNNRIEMSHLDGKFRQVLVWKNIDTPKSLALNPYKGYIYWSNWGAQPKIEQAYMDGSERSVLIDNTERAIGLTIDYDENMIYWINSDQKFIAKVFLDGSNMKIISSNLQNPHSLTIYQDYIYWSDWSALTIERCNKRDGNARTLIKSNLQSVLDMVVYHGKRQIGWNMCVNSKQKCSHTCLPIPNGMVCSCPTHYLWNENIKKCMPPKEFLLYSQKHAITRLVISPEDTPEVVLPIKLLKNVQSIAYDPWHNIFFWIDGRTNNIRHAFDNGTHLGLFLFNSGNFYYPYDIAFDIVSHLLYWSCSRNDVINVSRIDGNPVGVIIGGQGQGEKPRHIALHSGKGLLFWTNLVSSAEIVRCQLDGTHCSVIVSNLEQPEAIVVDQRDDLIFWADAKLNRIERCNLEGNNHIILLEDEVFHSTSLAVLDSYLFWIDKEQQIIERLNKITGNDRTIIQTHLSQLSDILTVQFNHEMLTNACHPTKHSCSHLCLISATGEAYCSCPNSLVLKTETGQCEEPPPCSDAEFSCHNGRQCIPLGWRCDSQPECEDHSDELNCPSVCRQNQFRCLTGECLDQQFECDNKLHCVDGSDEHCCNQDFWFCRFSQTCLPSNELCNGIVSCEDGTDEIPEACGLQHLTKSPKYNYIIGVLAGSILLSIILGAIYIYKKRLNKNSETQFRTRSASFHENGNVSYASLNKREASSANYREANKSRCQIHLRDHPYVIGANSSSSGSTRYPQIRNPPPSPVTDIHAYISPVVHSYKLYNSHNRPPPPTPYSTDFCESDSCTFVYDEDIFPPPPTPRSHFLSDETSCPPSPSTEHSFYHSFPLGPAPSPTLITDR